MTGVVAPTPRFVPVSGQHIVDASTGLMWWADQDCLATEYGDEFGDGRMTWTEALALVAGLNDGMYPLCTSGRGGWRLANVREAVSITLFPEDADGIETAGFTGTTGSRWTSTTSGADTSRALVSSLSKPSVAFPSKDAIYRPVFVRNVQADD